MQERQVRNPIGRRRGIGAEFTVSRRALLAGLAAPLCGSAETPAEQALALRKAAAGDGEKAVLDLLEGRARDSLAAIRRSRTRADADRYRADLLRGKLRESLGLGRLPGPLRVRPRQVGILTRAGYRIEKLTYETLPDVEVPAHVYAPEQSQGRGPAILFYCGHWWEDSKTKPDFQAFCINMARAGFVVMTFDPFGQGERGVSNRDHRRTEMLLTGVSQQGIAEYETRCALAYLAWRRDVDPRRIGFTGASGGGYNTWITAALDDRIAVAVPVVGTSEFYEQISVCRPLDWYNANEHCHFVPNLIRYANNHEFVAMIAPRPLMIIAASQDQSFPVEGVRQVFKYGEEIYAGSRDGEKVSYYEDSTTGHGYQQKKREAAYGWFLKWLMNRGDGAPFPEPPTETEPWDSPELRCFPPGENKPAGPGIAAMAAKLAGATRTPKAKPRLAEVLGVADSGSAAPVRLEDRPVQRVVFRAQDGLSIPAFALQAGGERKGFLLALDDNGKEDLAAEPLVEEARRAGWAVAGVDVRGIGELSTSKPGWVFAVSLLLGENFVWRQALDLVAASRQLPAAPLAVYARGHNAALAATYALAVMQGVRWFVLRDGFLSFRQFLERPESMRASFALHTGERYRKAVYDREIPSEYFVFDVLRHFDLPQLLESLTCPGLIANPIDGDWKRMSEPEARRFVEPRTRLECSAAADAVLASFRALLTA
ncbi:MAG: prolyl oligopeptidase family serine peptidase [Bryobacteraceae bacterium]|nr:prolyl oligopeptidase family serine peptidase [Bryobacteraceae bacterium]